MSFTLSADAYRILVHIADVNEAPAREVLESILFRAARDLSAGELYELDLGGISFSMSDGAQRYLAKATAFHERRIERITDDGEDGPTPPIGDEPPEPWKA